MKILLCISVLAVLSGLGVAAPTCVVEGNCKGKLPFYQVDCMENLKFKHHKASCYMNDADEFLILALNEERISKRSIDDLESYRSPAGDKALIYRLKRNTNTGDAEVLSSNDIKKLLNQNNDVITESPVTSIATSDNDPNSNADGDDDTPKGIIIVISFDRKNTDIASGDETSLTDGGEDEMAEALLGLLLLGAIMDEINKQQINGMSNEDE